MLPGPTFICPGAQKAGTTWLHRQLRQHPEFWMPPQKEVDYLAPFPTSRKKYAERSVVVRERLGAAKNTQKQLEWWEFFVSEWKLDKYPQLFAPARGKFSGDVSPNYSTMSREEIKLAARVAPQAKIVILLRNPVARAWSHARHAIMRGSKKDLPAAELLNAMAEFAMSKQCLSNGDYVTIIRNWQLAFGESRVQVSFYDDLVERPLELLNRILSFVGANALPPGRESNLQEVVNKGEDYPCPPRLQDALSAYYSPMIAKLRDELGFSEVGRWSF